MATETLAVKLLLDANQYKREAAGAATATGKISSTATTATTATGKLSKGMTVLGTTAKVAMVGAFAGAGVAVADFVQDSGRAFSELQQSVGGTEAVFGEASGAVDDFARKSAEAAGLSEAEFRTATTLIGGQLKRMTGDVNLAADQSVRLTQVAADLAATYGGTTAEAVQALGSAFRGEADPAERFNLDLKVSKVNAKAAALGLVDAEGKVTDYGKAQATIALIMEQSTDAQGQFARELDTVAGQAQVTSARLEDLKAQLGERLAPVQIAATDRMLGFFDVLDSDVNLGWSQRLSAAFQLALGESADSVDAYVAQKEALNDLAEAGMKPITEETANLVEVTEESIGAANRHRGAIEETGDAAGDAADDIEGHGDEVEETGKKTKTAAERVRDLANAYLEAANPVFAAQSALDRYREAQENLTSIQEDGASTAIDIANAELDVAEAALEAEGALRDLGDGNINRGISTIADALGKSDEEARLLLEALGILDGTTVSSVVDVNFRSSGDLVARHAITQGGQVVGVQSGGIIFRQHGGPVAANQPYIIGEAGPEVFVPNQSGTIISNDQMTATTGGVASSGTQGSTFNVFTLTWSDFLTQVQKAGVDIRRYGW